jgi:hypothetical protein
LLLSVNRERCFKSLPRCCALIDAMCSASSSAVDSRSAWVRRIVASYNHELVGCYREKNRVMATAITSVRCEPLGLAIFKPRCRETPKTPRTEVCSTAMQPSKNTAGFFQPRISTEFTARHATVNRCASTTPRYAPSGGVSQNFCGQYTPTVHLGWITSCALVSHKSQQPPQRIANSLYTHSDSTLVIAHQPPPS